LPCATASTENAVGPGPASTLRPCARCIR
jgi:hypothetical protein